MAQVPDTRKVFNFRVDINGMNQFEIQKVTLPDVEIDEVKHGDTNYDVKTPGRVTVGDMVFEKIRPAFGSDAYFWNWLNLSQDQFAAGSLSPVYQQVLTIRELAPDGITTLNSWMCFGCWVKKVSGGTLDRNASENVIETVTLSVERMKRI